MISGAATEFEGSIMTLRTKDCDEIDSEIDLLGAVPRINLPDVERIFARILSPLLRTEGFRLIQTPRTSDGGVDFIGERQGSDEASQSERCAVQVNYYRGKVDTAQVHRLIGAALHGKFSRAILVASSDFTQSAHDFVSRDLPLQVQLFGLSELRNWVSRLRRVVSRAVV